MLNKTTFDGVEIIKPKTWEIEPETVENVNRTEAGTDQVQIIRKDKWKISASYQVTSRWLRKFKEFEQKDFIIVNTYDISSGRNTDRRMRIRDFSAELVENSERVRNTEGLWNVSFTLQEF